MRLMAATAGALVSVVILMAIMVAEGERLNESSSSSELFWSTAAKEEPDKDSDSSAAVEVVNDQDLLDGGFSSLDGMLQWAIGLYLI